MKKPSLKVCLFGGFCLLNHGESITGLHGRSQQLLAYLILHRQAPQLRRRIAEALWPETQTSQALTNLRKELHYLRQVNAPVDQLLAITPKMLRWQPQIPCDVDIVYFETALANAENAEDEMAARRVETALLGCKGELWPDCDAEWIYPEQQRIKQSYVRALARMTQLLHSLGEIGRAIVVGQRWLQAEPLDEGATQSLMKLYGEAGDRATALRLYHQCMTALQAELGVNPSPTTAKIYQRLLMTEDETEKVSKISEDISLQPLLTPPPLSVSDPSHTLVGRDDLLETLKQWLSSTIDDSAPLLLLIGEPGIGKTRLLEALAETAMHHRWQSCWGHAFAAEQLRAYGVWIDLLRSGPQEILGSLLAEFDASASALQTSEQDHLQHRPLQYRTQLLDKITAGLRTLATPQQPLLLLFDDIQWLDESSTTLLHYVFRLLGKGSLKIACAARWKELQDNSAALTLIKSLKRENRLQEETVSPLSAKAVMELVKPLDPDKLYADSGGNPLFALESARASTQKAHNLSGLIDDRLQRLDGAARDLLPWAAALGRRFNPEILALAASYPPMQFLKAIEQLEQQKIVRPIQSSAAHEQSSYDFVHDLIRKVAYEQLSAPRRRIVHGQLAKTLEAQMVEDDLAAQVAYHAGIAGNHSLAAQSCLAAATRSVRLFAYEEAIQLVFLGLQHAQSLQTRDRLLYSAKFWETRILAGISKSEATSVKQQLNQLLGEMNGLALPEAELFVHQAIALLHYEQGNLSDVHRQCLKSLDVIPPTPQLQAKTLAINGSCLAAIEQEMERAEALLLEAQSLANRLGLSLCDVDQGLGCIHRYRGRYDLAIAHFHQALQLAQNQQDHWATGCNLSFLAMTAWDSHQPDLDYAQALLALSPQLPRGSDAAFAQALIILQGYAQEASKPPPALNEALHRLDELDAQRKIVFVASHACELALAQGDAIAAMKYATTTHQAAERIEHPGDIAIAQALCLLSNLATEHKAKENYEAMQQQKRLKALNARSFSVRVQIVLTEALNQLQFLNPVRSKTMPS
ncbi:Bacterial transcriptional activator domain family [Synechococcus sp. PCC 7335]|uniref:AAA family ATPase n=1 Tax=Synechococcus sp. (strain ATCC 29403 / PCC 7335) TaxID=91464 RepID=UPI00017EC09D|nr:AAA family ATPase [Synechococcus sp. PCC 7335]EDX83400.1 Bacterial transcriptional activator domain family [Synechococcus sp. PCC 7335]